MKYAVIILQGFDKRGVNNLRDGVNRNRYAVFVAILPAIQTAFTIINSKILSLTAAAQLEAQVISGMSIGKVQLKQNLSQQAADMAELVYACTSS